VSLSREGFYTFRLVCAFLSWMQCSPFDWKKPGHFFLFRWYSNNKGDRNHVKYFLPRFKKTILVVKSSCIYSHFTIPCNLTKLCRGIMRIQSFVLIMTPTIYRCLLLNYIFDQFYWPLNVQGWWNTLENWNKIPFNGVYLSKPLGPWNHCGSCFRQL